MSLSGAGDIEVGTVDVLDIASESRANNGLPGDYGKRMFGHSRKHSDTAEFKEMSKVDAQANLAQELDKLLRTTNAADRQVVEQEFKGFQMLYQKFIQDTGPSIQWDLIEPPPQNTVIDYELLKAPDPATIKGMLNKLVVVKLNGGLGTSMGCKGPKSIIPVRNDLTFLDLTVQQMEHLNRTYGADMPLVLMNSFNTDEDTSKVLRKYKGFKVKVYTFMQSRYPRINKETLLPVAVSMTRADTETFYPPGHGDFYAAFYQSGLLHHFIKEGREVCFVSNIDNLGATVDLNILNTLLTSGKAAAPDFVMEVTDKTRADVKGGTLIQYEGRLRLLEIAQVPKENIDEFKSVKKFKIFNTNNLWMRLSSIADLVSSGSIDMEVIVNQKTLDNGINVIQLETAAGAAMKDFSRALGISVPRSRFLPVKKTSDLLLVMSNLYSMKSGSLVMSPLRAFPSVPLVKLGEHHFSKVRDFLSRFASIPDILELDHLTVSGDVTFGKGVSLRGTVIIIANHGERIDIPACALLENKIVSGNLRILDH